MSRTEKGPKARRRERHLQRAADLKDECRAVEDRWVGLGAYEHYAAAEPNGVAGVV